MKEIVRMQKKTNISQALAGFSVVLALPMITSASSINVEVTTVNSATERVLVSGSGLGALKVGDVVSVSSSCMLEVVRRTGSNALLSTEICENKSALVPKRRVALSVSSASAASATTTSEEVVPSPQSAPQVAPTVDSRSLSFRPSLKAGEKASSGFRLGLVKSMFDGKFEAKQGRTSVGVEATDIDHDFGIALGYARIPVQEPGFTSRLLYTQFNQKVQSLRLEGNGTYGFNEYVHVLAGLNAHNYVKGVEGAGAGLGFQAGLGVQATKNFGMDLTYVYLQNSASSEGVAEKLKLTGPEITAHVTF